MDLPESTADLPGNVHANDEDYNFLQDDILDNIQPENNFEIQSNDNAPTQADDPIITTTRSGRVVRHTERYVESQRLHKEGIVVYSVEYEVLDPNLYAEEDRLAELDDPIAFAFKATGDPDTFYMNEALRQPDAHEFKKAMVKEVVDHTNNKHWEVIEKKDLPAGCVLLPAVWAMR